jgi:Rrf2 family iron-sulfur cluster assembly transcriptional regulator
MRLTTKGRFAVTAMIDVAMHGSKGPVTLAGVSERQKISLSYLEQLFGKLRRAGLVESVRGPGGGYNLARAAETVSVADVILAVDEPIDATNCGGKASCQDDGQRCMTHELWTNLNTHIFAYLRAVNLAQLVAAQGKAGVAVLRDHRLPEPAGARSSEREAVA